MTVYDLIDATWPAAEFHTVGPWIIRQGLGGGSRVSAATARSPVGADERSVAELAMQELGQSPIFMIRPGDEALDTQLAAAGYVIRDPVTAYAGPVPALAALDLPTKSAFLSWPPLAIQAEIWAAGGVGPGRLAIMDRVVGPKISFLGRVRDQAAGCAFVACNADQAMLHALAVLPEFRRQGLGRHLLIAAARWAKAQGGQTLSLVVTRANTGANTLYTSLGMGVVGQYHYRVWP